MERGVRTGIDVVLCCHVVGMSLSCSVHVIVMWCACDCHVTMQGSCL